MKRCLVANRQTGERAKEFVYLAPFVILIARPRRSEVKFVTQYLGHADRIEFRFQAFTNFRWLVTPGTDAQIGIRPRNKHQSVSRGLKASSAGCSVSNTGTSTETIPEVSNRGHHQSTTVPADIDFLHPIRKF